MARTRLIDAIVFDLGGVLMLNGRPSDIAGRFPGHDPAVLIPIIMGPHDEDSDHPWHRLERGEITMAELRAANREALAAQGVTMPRSAPGTSAPPRAVERNDAMFDLVSDARAAGLRTAILTNNVREFRPLWWPMAAYDELFDVIVDSHEVGCRKPDPAIYRLTLDRLGVPAARAAFLDDIAPNAAAATSVGMHGLLVEGAGQAAIARARELAGLA
jgi:epoxide hydrolase-like predicted phosphatase